MDNAVPPLLPQLAALAAAVAAWTAAGWHVFRHTQEIGFKPPFASSLLVGMGLWLVVWVLVVALGGGHTVVAVAVYGVMMMVLALPTLRHWARDRGVEEHLTTVLMLQAVMLAPWLLALPQVAAVGVEDFRFLQVLQLWDGLGRWPQNEVEGALLAVQPWPAGLWVPLLMPLAVVTVGVALPVAFNLLVVLAAAGGVGGLVYPRVKWSNALWVSVLGMAGTAMVAPWWWPASWVAPLALLPLLAAACAMAPLVRREPLPVGFGAVPFAVLLAVLSVSHMWGLAAVAVVAGGWLIRGGYEHGPRMGVVLAVSLLLCGPLLLVAGMLQAGLLPEMGHCWQARDVACWVGLGTVPDGVRLAGALAVVPLVVGLQSVYAGSRLAAVAYKRPWGLAMLLAGPLVLGALVTVPYVRLPVPPMVQHVDEVAADMAGKRILPATGRLAVQGVPEVGTAAMAYKLGLPMGQPVVLPDDLTLAAVHATARANGITHIWQGPWLVGQAVGVSHTLGVSVVYEVGGDSMIVRGLYPLPTSE